MGEIASPGRVRSGRRLVFAGVALIAVAGAVAVDLAAAGAPPDVVLRRTSEPVDTDGLEMVARERGYLKSSTLQGFERYRRIDIFAGTSILGVPCLVAVDRVGDISTSCVPEPAELFVDISDHGLPAGARARLILRGETVEVFEYFPEH